MAKVKYNLFDGKAEDETYVFLIFRYSGVRLKYSTGLKINPKFWDFTKQCAKSTVKFPFHAEFNTALNNLDNEVIRIFKKHQFENKPLSLDDFKTQLDQFTKKTLVATEDVRVTLFTFIEQFIRERTNQPRGTTKLFGTFFNHLKAFAEFKGKKKFDFESINLDFFHAFTNFLYAEPRAHSTNYASKMIDIFRQMLDDATERGYNTNLAYRSRKFRIAKEEVATIYLNGDDLKKMYEYDFSKNGRLERVRDLFIIGAFSGLRFSDFTSIKPEHIKTIDGVSLIRIATQKTGANVTIPIHTYIRQILKKYGNKIPRPLSNQKMNDYLKEIGQIVGIDSQEILVKSKAGKRVTIKEPKYQLISTHTARRSFATNAYKAGLPTVAIMKITGHTIERQFLKYIKVSKEESAVLIANNAFFNI